jgi:hypothetical protein
MSFADLFRKDRPNKMQQLTPSRLLAEGAGYPERG